MNEYSSNNAHSESIQGKIDLLFIQLGFEKSRHLIQNIKLIHGMFPDILIHCVISKGSVLEQDLPHYVNCIVYAPEKMVDDLFDRSNIDLSFRKGYWRYTLERLIAIKSAYIQNPDSKFIHVESDVFLLPSFPFINFLNVEKVAWLPYDRNSDIASLMYFPSCEKNLEFTEDLMSLLLSNPRLTDMQALYELRNMYQERYYLLPTSKENFVNLRNSNVESASRLADNFEGIFDSLPIGMWLTGIDPRNDFGFTRYFETEKIRKMRTFMQPSEYLIQFVNNSELIYQTTGNSLKIYNLHVHSKSKEIFSANWNNEIERLVELSSQGKGYSEFSLKLFVELIFHNLSKGTLIEYIYNSPLFFNVRRFKQYLKRKNNRSQ
jgi:hypothetical protein